MHKPRKDKLHKSLVQERLQMQVAEAAGLAEEAEAEASTIPASATAAASKAACAGSV